MRPMTRPGPRCLIGAYLTEAHCVRDPLGLMEGLQHRESKHLALAVGRQVGQSGNSHAVREPSINGRLDEIGREEGE